MTTLIFLKKELLEGLRTSKVMIVGAIFFFFALMSPALAKYTNEILKEFGGIENLVLPEPTYIDSFIQLFKNFNFMGIIALILAFMGSMSREKDKKTVYLMLTKGLSRRGMYLAKYLSASLIFTIIYLLSCLVFYGYTRFMFGDFSNEHIVFAFFVYWIYGLFIIAMTLFFSNLTSNISVSATLSICGFFFLTILTQIKAIKTFVPGRLTGLPIEILMKTTSVSNSLLTVFTTLGLSVLLIAGGIAVFQEQEL